MRVFFVLLGVSLLSGCNPAPASPSQTTISNAQPAATVQALPITTQTFDGAFTITLQVTPDHAGTNTFLAKIIDNQSGKAALHVTVIAYTTMQDMAMGTDTVYLLSKGNGLFGATSDNLSMKGHWAIGITIQTADQIIHRAGVNLLLLI